MRVMAACLALIAAACSPSLEATRRAQSIAAGTSQAGNAGAHLLCAQGLIAKPSSNQPGAPFICLPASQSPR
jgi:hypothetical protein